MKYFFILVLLPWVIYGFSKIQFRKLKKYILAYGIVFMIISIVIIIKDINHFIPYGLLLMPIMTTLIIIYIEKIFYSMYDRELKESAFWYIGNGYKTKEENIFNPLILILSLLIPFILLLILPMYLIKP